MMKRQAGTLLKSYPHLRSRASQPPMPWPGCPIQAAGLAVAHAFEHLLEALLLQPLPASPLEWRSGKQLKQGLFEDRWSGVYVVAVQHSSKMSLLQEHFAGVQDAPAQPGCCRCRQPRPAGV